MPECWAQVEGLQVEVHTCLRLPGSNGTCCAVLKFARACVVYLQFRNRLFACQPRLAALLAWIGDDRF